MRGEHAAAEEADDKSDYKIDGEFESAAVEDGKRGIGGPGGAGVTGVKGSTGVPADADAEDIEGKIGVTVEGGAEAPGSAEGEDGAAEGADAADAEIAFYALGQNPLDISVEWRVILRTQPWPQPRDPPAHAQRAQKCRQLALHRLLVECARIDAGCLETIEISYDKPNSLLPNGLPTRPKATADSA
jgi:hypothetical protein